MGRPRRPSVQQENGHAFIRTTPRRRVDGPTLEQQDWDDLAGVEEAVSRPDNGDLRYPAGSERKPGRLAGENDDNPQQRSDEALPDDGEEQAIAESNFADDSSGSGRGRG